MSALIGTRGNRSAPEYSVVIPLYNEEENIGELYRRLSAVLAQYCSQTGMPDDRFEVIFVDDGSTDRSWETVGALHARDGRVRGIRFSRNFGHHAAVLAGIAHSQGAFTILMDGDLQDPPEEIPKLLAKAQEGFDIVQGVMDRRHSGFLNNLASRLFNILFVRLANVDPRTRSGLFRCLSRKAVESINALGERTIFFGGMVSWIGHRTAHVTVNRAPRHLGTSKYNFLRRLALALNAITSFSERPLIVIFQMGIMVVLFSIGMFLYTILNKLVYGTAIMGWTSLFAAIFLSTGIITLSLSVVGLYIAKLFLEVKQRPRYIISEKIL